MKIYYWFNTKSHRWYATPNKENIPECYEYDEGCIHKNPNSKKIYLTTIFKGYEYGYSDPYGFGLPDIAKPLIDTNGCFFNSIKKLKKKDSLWNKYAKLAQENTKDYHVKRRYIASDLNGKPFISGNATMKKIRIAIVSATLI